MKQCKRKVVGAFAVPVLLIRNTVCRRQPVAVDEMSESIFQPHDQPPFDESWREVIQRRSAELRSGRVTPVPWAEVKRQARENDNGLFLEISNDNGCTRYIEGV